MMEKWQVSDIFEFFLSFNFDLKYFWNLSFLHYENIWYFKKVIYNLEPEDKGVALPWEWHAYFS